MLIQELHRQLEKATGVARLEILEKLIFQYFNTSIDKIPSLNQQLLAEATAQKNISKEIRAYSNFGMYYCENNEVAQAEFYFEKGLALALQSKDDKLISAIYNNYSLLYVSNNLEKSFGLLSNALAYSTKANYLPFMCRQYNNLANNLSIIEPQNPLVLEYLEKGTSIAQEIGDWNEVVMGCIKIAEYYKNKQEYANALNYLDRVEKLILQIENLYYEAIRYDVYGQVYLEMKVYEKTIFYAKKALNLYQKISLSDKIAYAHHILGAAYLHLNELDNALHHLTKAKEICLKIAIMRVPSINEQMIALALKTNDYATAFALSQETLITREKYLSEEKRKEVAKYQIKFETERKERENVELKLKALRSQMNPHFIFNTLNAIQSFVAKNDNIKAMKFIAKFAQLMRQILNGSDVQFISIDREVEFIRNYMSIEQARFDGSFEFEINIDEEIEPDLMQIPPMILQPYIENAILHGMKGIENGKITVSFDIDDKEESLVCTVEDNGIGRKKAQELKQNLTNTHQSMGTRVTEERLAALNKELATEVSVKYEDLMDKNGNSLGTKLVILLPLQYISL